MSVYDFNSYQVQVAKKLADAEDKKYERQKKIDHSSRMEARKEAEVKAGSKDRRVALSRRQQRALGVDRDGNNNNRKSTTNDENPFKVKVPFAVTAFQDFITEKYRNPPDVAETEAETDEADDYLSIKLDDDDDDDDIIGINKPAVVRRRKVDKVTLIYRAFLSVSRLPLEKTVSREVFDPSILLLFSITIVIYILLP